jgi:hypothetical protein
MLDDCPDAACSYGLDVFTDDAIPLEALPWTARSSSMPGLPGPGPLWLEQLFAVLSELQTGQFNDPKRTLEVRESARKIDLAGYANQLAPSHLIVRTADLGIQRTEYASAWLSSRDSLFLARVFHRHIRYVGELLAHLSDGPLSVQQISQRANEDFRVGWEGLDPVRRRLRWLSLLGFVDEAGALSYRLTEAGRDALPILEPESPEHLWAPSPSDGTDMLPAAPLIAELLDELRNDTAVQEARKHVLAYIPAAYGQTPIESLRALTSAAVPEITQTKFDETCTDLFGVKASSASSALTTMRTLGLYEPSGRGRFTATAVAREWLETGNDVDLLRIIHAHLRFVGEVLLHIDELKRVPQLHRYAVAEYGLEATNPSSTAKVVQLLRTVGLITETGYAQYESTALGKALLAELPLATTKSEEEKQTLLLEIETVSTADAADLDSLVEELAAAAVDSQSPTRFEKAIARAFTFLGLEAHHVGGPGNTDVVVELGVGSVSSGRGIVDAKSSASGSIGEKMINFQALKEHKLKHAATLAAVVGPAFQDGRLREWAVNEDVALVSIEQLTTALRRQLVTPLSPDELVNVFDARQGWSNLEEIWSGYDRRNQLLSLVVGCFLRETQEDDPVLGSSLDLLSIYRALRDQLRPKPDTAEIQSVLDFLSSPFVNVIALKKSGYELRESPITSGRRLRAFGFAIANDEQS